MAASWQATPLTTEVPRSDLRRGAAGAGRRAVRQAGGLLPRRPARRGDHRPPRTGRETGRPRGLREPAPPAPEGLVPEDRATCLVKVVVHVDGGARGNP